MTALAPDGLRSAAIIGDLHVGHVGIKRITQARNGWNRVTPLLPQVAALLWIGDLSEGTSSAQGKPDYVGQPPLETIEAQDAYAIPYTNGWGNRLAVKRIPGNHDMDRDSSGAGTITQWETAWGESAGGYLDTPYFRVVSPPDPSTNNPYPAGVQGQVEAWVAGTTKPVLLMSHWALRNSHAMANGRVLVDPPPGAHSPQTSDFGTATATAATSVQDTTKAWTTGAFVGLAVWVGSAYAKITANTATTLTVDHWRTVDAPLATAATPPPGAYSISGSVDSSAGSLDPFYEGSISSVSTQFILDMAARQPNLVATIGGHTHPGYDVLGMVNAYTLTTGRKLWVFNTSAMTYWAAGSQQGGAGHHPIAVPVLTFYDDHLEYRLRDLGSGQWIARDHIHRIERLAY